MIKLGIKRQRSKNKREKGDRQTDRQDRQASEEQSWVKAREIRHSLKKKENKKYLFSDTENKNLKYEFLSKQKEWKCPFFCFLILLLTDSFDHAIHACMHLLSIHSLPLQTNFQRSFILFFLSPLAAMTSFKSSKSRANKTRDGSRNN